MIQKKPNAVVLGCLWMGKDDQRQAGDQVYLEPSTLAKLSAGMRPAVRKLTDAEGVALDAAAESAPEEHQDTPEEGETLDTPEKQLAALGADNEQIPALIEAGFNSIESVQKASQTELVDKVKGVGAATAKKMKEAAQSFEVVED